MAVITGLNGEVLVGGVKIARITKWDINPTVGETAWGDSDSAGHTNREPGRKDSTGNIEGKLDQNDDVTLLFVPGDKVNLTLWLSATALDYYYVPAMIQGISFEVDVDTQAVVGWSATFGENGRTYFPNESGAPVVNLP